MCVIKHNSEMNTHKLKTQLKSRDTIRALVSTGIYLPNPYSMCSPPRDDHYSEYCAH